MIKTFLALTVISGLGLVGVGLTYMFIWLADINIILVPIVFVTLLAVGIAARSI